MARGSKKPNEACASHTELHFYRLVKSHLPRSGNWGPSGVLGLDTLLGNGVSGCAFEEEPHSILL